MAGFCVSCGTPLTGPFCNKCGARAIPPGASAQPSAPNVPQAVPPAQAGFQPVNIPTSPAQPVQAGYQAVNAPIVAAPKSSGVGRVLREPVLWFTERTG